MKIDSLVCNISDNGRSTLAQRGKGKEGRKALRIVGLALLVSADFQVPLLHRTYPGTTGTMRRPSTVFAPRGWRAP